jgi:predicted dienelactone hydrolase
MKTAVLGLVALAFLGSGCGENAQPESSAPPEAAYDPLAIEPSKEVRSVDLVVDDPPRQIPLRVYLPATPQPAPVVMFSHGLGGSRENNPYLGQHWSARGYLVVFVQHPGSDSAVWQDVPPGQRLMAMQKAASLANFRLRVQDIPAVIDQLETWNQQAGHPLHGRMNLEKIGMSGHSFGAVTTQAVSGQSAGRLRLLTADPRIDAALAMSPSTPRIGTANEAFGKVAIPWMLMTGTKDVVPLLSQADATSRLEVFAALPPGDKFQLVLHNGEHSAFSDRPLAGDTQPPNPNHHRLILALSTAFWDSFLNNDPAARSWLNSTGPTSLLEPNDLWNTK